MSSFSHGRRSPHLGYPDTPLGEQKRPFGETFNAFALLREHFSACGDTTDKEAQLIVEQIDSILITNIALTALAAIGSHSDATPAITQIALQAVRDMANLNEH